MTTRPIAAVTVLLAAAIVPVANAVIINVPGDQPTIQAGIDAAMNGDEIVVAPGTYFETIHFTGKAVWLHSSDGPEVTIISANGPVGDDSAVTCDSGEGSNTAPVRGGRRGRMSAMRRACPWVVQHLLELRRGDGRGMTL